MTMLNDDQFAEKHSIVNELFINTADDNYIAARWCFHENLNVDFFWLAVHCLEKYLKAALLLNGHSSRSYRHDIIRLYEAVKPLAPELLPKTLVKPSDMPINVWRQETVEQFVRRLYRDGQADNRYQLYGYSRQAEDLWKLDQLVFSVRRLCQPLELHFFDEKIVGLPDETRRQRMSKDHPCSWVLRARLEETIEGKRGTSLQHAALNWNRPFAPENYKHTEMEYRSSVQNPVLVRRIYDPLAGGAENLADADRLWDWVKSSIQLPKDLIDEIEIERENMKNKYS
ncbi:hypothetical protein ASD45_03655 [Pseudolabrys sp. Root1462]|uniref:HEPN domain-containing protein n=1 Tax=Pseudolabrys sp. Root1462 TaxID=1736466 RepID=UPI0007031822|nr:HEPN domain-containing protein [Pseudolabrys sp. Root1462]KQY99994.1 hypothetical protein ASD45_03655 [Pseudolabrys sp. Root1462]